ncbi:MAG: hemerythrin domain-containing protein [Kiloniellales bacterium]
MPDSKAPPELESPALDSGGLDEPLDLILSEHMRQNTVCGWLSTCADSEDMAAILPYAERLLAFLTEDLPRHCEDEERDLFPLLRQRCAREDGVERIVDQLSAEHALDRDVVDFLVDDLQRLVAHGRLPNPIRFFINLKAFAVTQMRHLAWENRTVLPLARRRLTDADLADLGRRMAARRGIELPA